MLLCCNTILKVLKFHECIFLITDEYELSSKKTKNGYDATLQEGHEITTVGRKMRFPSPSGLVDIY